MPQNEWDKQLSPIRHRLADVECKAPNRWYLPCEAEHVYEVCRFLFYDLGLRFVISTGIDAEDCFEVLHHFSDDASGTMVTVKAFIRDRESPQIDSITPLIPGAEWTEREIHDLLGIGFRNHPNLQRLILADDWPEGVYPLRKEVQT
ncbi:NADH-quinone oxidoreductase subunit C [Anaerobaca lacustris]|uniref:NADH-quinone oxidoreductase subunit C n=1 Tax=Anaerobaca lacustris TaxID=3044600 RepID=A0AAW6U789_9BACT|nr:NADH-quinone oxidoreductase subunit C [Sedimentisphaerales bacterium M17dextr]